MSGEVAARGEERTFFKGYYLITSRCNLDCTYCVLEDAPHQLRRELDGEGKRALISHLYRRLGFRRLTLSGGEALLIGRRAPEDFLDLIEFLRGFRSDDPMEHLEIELYTNGTLLDDRIADALVGVVDIVAITIDSSAEATLARLGRSTREHPGYLEGALRACERLARRGLAIKLHTVIGAINVGTIADEIREILATLARRGVHISSLKLYQYMSYDVPDADRLHAISAGQFAAAEERVRRAVEGRDIPIHFKNNEEMNASLFNILPYGNAQYLRPGDSWSTSRRTRDLREYGSMDELFGAHDIDEAAIRRCHTIRRSRGLSR